MKTRILAILVVLTAFFALSCENPENNPPENGNNVSLTGLTADGSDNLTTSKLILTFDKDIDGLAAADIILTAGSTGAVKGVLTPKTGGIYELTLTNITTGGMVTVSVVKSGCIITGVPKQATIYCKQGPGNSDGDDDEIPPELVAKWYTSQALADAGTGTATVEFTEEGKLLYMGIDNQLTITVENNVISNYRSGSKVGTVKYTLSGTAINFSESTGEQILSTSLTFYKKGESQVIQDIEAAFTNLTQDGNSGKITAKLTLTFDKDIDGLEAADISLEAGATGAVKGSLTKTGTGTYDLTISGITTGGTIGISVSKTGYIITGGPKNVTVYFYEEILTGTYGNYEYSYGAITQTITITGYTVKGTGYFGTGGNISIPTAIDGKPVTAIKYNNNDDYYGDGVFQYKQLTGVTIPSSITYIGDWAFSQNQLTNINIPNGVTYIGNDAFLSAAYVSYGHEAEKYNLATSVIIPNSVTYIGSRAFNYNWLITITIPDNVTIEAECFDYNILTSITIGSNVNFLDYYGKTTDPTMIEHIDRTVIPYETRSNGFFEFYRENNKASGKYIRSDANSTTWTKVN